MNLKTVKNLCLAVVCVQGVLSMCHLVGCQSPQPTMSHEVQYGPSVMDRRPPADAPTLDYESMVGLDPQTVQTNDERQRNNDHDWRIDRLERQVRDLNQIVRGVTEMRIGESQITSPSDRLKTDRNLLGSEAPESIPLKRGID